VTPERNHVLRLDVPSALPSCVVADSPHSGCEYPADFGYACDFTELRKAEDAGIDALYDFLPALGVPFLQAQFPRSYIDPNRRDTVSDKLAREGDQPFHPSFDEMLRDRCSPRSTQAVYDRTLSLSEVFNRVAGYYQPYHDALDKMIEETQAQHGKAVHLNCHSMPSMLRHGQDVNPYDVALGTLGGSSCAPEIAERLRELFEEKGYKTGINVPGFSGREILRRHGKPAEGCHSIQIELNRALYMDEEKVAPSANAAKLRDDLKEIMTAFTKFCDDWQPAPPHVPKDPALRP
jgi:N-formylglutamate deformylase